jgi:hypothetical protein
LAHRDLDQHQDPAALSGHLARGGLPVRLLLLGLGKFRDGRCKSVQRSKRHRADAMVTLNRVNIMRLMSTMETLIFIALVAVMVGVSLIAAVGVTKRRREPTERVNVSILPAHTTIIDARVMRVMA